MQSKRVLTLAATILAVASLPSMGQARPLRHARSTQLTAEDTLRLEAARALYGVGLDIKRTPRRTTIAPKPGGLTQEKYNRYVKEVYLPQLRIYLAKLHGGHWRWRKDGYLDQSAPRDRRGRLKEGRWDPRGPVKRAHLLLEPYLKYTLCRKIVGQIGNKPTIVQAFQRTAWCALQAMQEAIAPIYEYRGQRVTWDAAQDRGNLKLDDVIWRKDASGNYPMVVTVRGGSKIYTLASTNILFNLSKGIDSTLTKKEHRQAAALHQKTLKIYHRMVKQIARTQRKLAGRRKIIFGKQRFYSTIAQPPTQGPVPCDQIHYLAYGPTQARREGYHIGQEVNGVECAAFNMAAGEVDRNDIGGLGCNRYLKPGRNKIEVGVFLSHNDFNYKRREWRREDMRYRRKTVTYTKTRRGKKLYSTTITCVK